MPSTQAVTVVGVALLARREGQLRVLAARRSSPPDLAGRWGLPGGKCEPGESLEDAAVREIAEELGCAIRVTGHLEGVEPIRAGLSLQVVTAELSDGEPHASEHDDLRWLALDDLDDVAWLPADVGFVTQLPARFQEGA